ncbi:MAG: hypothetical protein K0B52_04995, partial [FCB group bacterium]|nr:hypothetical protein [FCB group bacterium]
MKRILNIGSIILLILAFTFGSAVAQEAKSIPTRDQIEEQYRWNLVDIYVDNEAWEQDFTYVEDNLDILQKYKGRLGRSASILENCLRDAEMIERKLDKMYIYAHLMKDQDTRNEISQSMSTRIAMLAQRYYQERAFLWPE